MEITTDSLPWDSDDVANWNAFLNTKTGKHLIPKVAEIVPELLGSGDINVILIRSGEVRGFQEAIRQLLALTRVNTGPVPQDLPSYPPLENNAYWEGDKLETK